MADLANEQGIQLRDSEKTRLILLTNEVHAFATQTMSYLWSSSIGKVKSVKGEEWINRRGTTRTQAKIPFYNNRNMSDDDISSRNKFLHYTQVGISTAQKDARFPFDKHEDWHNILDRQGDVMEELKSADAKDRDDVVLKAILDTAPTRILNDATDAKKGHSPGTEDFYQLSGANKRDNVFVGTGEELSLDEEALSKIITYFANKEIDVNVEKTFVLLTPEVHQLLRKLDAFKNMDYSEKKLEGGGMTRRMYYWYGLHFIHVAGARVKDANTAYIPKFVKYDVSSRKITGLSKDTAQTAGTGEVAIDKSQATSEEKDADDAVIQKADLQIVPVIVFTDKALCLAEGAKKSISVGIDAHTNMDKILYFDNDLGATRVDPERVALILCGYKA